MASSYHYSYSVFILFAVEYECKFPKYPPVSGYPDEKVQVHIEKN